MPTSLMSAIQGLSSAVKMDLMLKHSALITNLRMTMSRRGLKELVALFTKMRRLTWWTLMGKKFRRRFE